MWMNILKSFEEQLKQGIKELEMNKVFDIQYVRRQQGSQPEIFEFIIKFDGSKYFQLSMSGEKGIGRDADTYRMIIKMWEEDMHVISPIRDDYGMILWLDLELAVIKPNFAIRGVFKTLSEFLEKVDDELLKFYEYLRSTAATPYLAEEKE